MPIAFLPILKRFAASQIVGGFWGVKLRLRGVLLLRLNKLFASANCKGLFIGYSNQKNKKDTKYIKTRLKNIVKAGRARGFY